MSTSTLALTGVASGSTALIAYTKRASGDTNTQYVGTNASDSLAAPRLIDVKLDVKSPGVVGNDRVEVSIKHTVLDIDNLPHTGSVTVKLSMPRVAQWTVELTKSLLKQAADYLGGQPAGTISGQTDTSSFPELWAQALVP